MRKFLARCSRTTVLNPIVALAIARCAPDPASLRWNLQFADAALEARAAQVQTRVITGGCTDDGVRYESVIRLRNERANGVPRPPTFGPGHYALDARAADLSCRTVAAGCLEMQLPLRTQDAVTVVLDAVTEMDVEHWCQVSSINDASMDARIDPSTAGTVPDGGNAGCTWTPYGTPVNLTQVNSTQIDGEPVLSSDGLTLYFLSNRANGGTDMDLYASRRTSASSGFQTPTAIAELNTTSREGGPAIRSDELQIFFTRVATTADIYVASRAQKSDPFSSVAAVTALNSSSEENAPALSADGLTLYFSSTRSGGAGGFDLWMAKRSSWSASFATPTAMTALNTSSGEGWASPSADGLELVFLSNRPAATTNDIWRATRTSTSATFASPQAIAEVNTAGVENDPSISPDGTVLFFASDRAGGQGAQDIWFATRTCVPN